MSNKKLIEVALPLDAINDASAYDKMPGIGPHPKGVHRWWAPLPLPTARAVLFASLVDDPSSSPREFATDHAQEKERQRLFDIIKNLVKHESSNNETVLAAAKREIARSVAWNRGEEPPKTDAEVSAYLAEKAPPVLDPFCGGGSIPLEAQRLGLRAYASELNPVAVLITKALIEIPPKFAGRPPVNPKAQAELQKGGHWQGKGAEGLAEDVRYYGKWMRDEAEKRIGHLYPKAKLPNGGEATVIAWLWARTVKCPNPACGAQMPLIRSFGLSNKKGKEAWVEPVVDRITTPPTVRFEVKTGSGKAPEGTVNRRGARCVCCDTPVPFSHVRAEGKAGRMYQQLMAIVAEGARGRAYFAPTDEHVSIAESAEPTWRPDAELPNNPRNFNTPIYGLDNFGKLFTLRQLVALTTFSDFVGEAREKVLQDACPGGLPDDGTPLNDGGTGAIAYADAVATYLAFGVDRCADFNCSLTRWVQSNEKVMNLFARQAIPMVWDYAEANILERVVGGWICCVSYISECLERVPAINAGHTKQLDAAAAIDGVKRPLVCTDPPYYDNIGYADLSDFFYVWLRRSLRNVYPDLFGTLLTPKTAELVATPYRFDGDCRRARQFFENGFGKAISHMRDAQAPGFPLTMIYAYKQAETEANSDGEVATASTGWETMLEGLLKADFTITSTWPVRASQKWRMISMGTSALASYIVLACRPRPADAPLGTRKEFVAALKRELPDALKKLQQGNIAPVDMAQASIGPGMAIFTRYAKVLEADDSPMTVKTALQLINQALDEYLSEQEAEYDADTRFAITWFETHGMDTGPYGTAETLATARGVAVSGVAEAGVLVSRGGKVRLLSRGEMPPDWDPETDKRLTVWECTQYLIRALENEGESAAAELLARLGARGEVARDLAYRLYGICERKKWAEEGIAYNGLVVAWPEISKLVAQAGPTGPAEPELGL